MWEVGSPEKTEIGMGGDKWPAFARSFDSAQDDIATAGEISGKSRSASWRIWGARKDRRGKLLVIS